MRRTARARATAVRRVAAVVSLAVAAVLVPPSNAAADPTVQQVVDRAVAVAADAGIATGVAVVDRSTGDLLAGRGDDEQYISESIVKLFTVAYYAHQPGGVDDQLAAELRTMIINSDDRIESLLWNTEIVPVAADRYGLSNTRNGPKTGPHDWAGN